jgi:hypothetical protein
MVGFSHGKAGVKDGQRWPVNTALAVSCRLPSLMVVYMLCHPVYKNIIAYIDVQLDNPTGMQTKKPKHRTTPKGPTPNKPMRSLQPPMGAVCRYNRPPTDP